MTKDGSSARRTSVVADYRTLRVSMETVPDLSRALWLAERANEREGIRPAKPEARQAEAFGRIVREWTSITIHSQPMTEEFIALTIADWRCACGATGLNAGGLRVIAGKALCGTCAGCG